MDCTNCEYSKELEKLKAEVYHLKEELGPEKPPCGSDCTCDDCDILKKCPEYKKVVDRKNALLDEHGRLTIRDAELNRLNSLHRDRVLKLQDDLNTEKRIAKIYRNTNIISIIVWAILIIVRVFGG